MPSPPTLPPTRASSALPRSVSPRVTPLLPTVGSCLCHSHCVCPSLPLSQGLDYEAKQQFVLHVGVANEVPFVVKLPMATATVTVTVEDVNEAPVFVPPVQLATVSEDVPPGQTLASCTAQDPDKAQGQRIK